MQRIIPDFFGELIKNEYGEELSKEIFLGYEIRKPTTFRVNTLKTSISEVKRALEDAKIEYNEISWDERVIILKDKKEDEIRNLELYKQGEIYMQSLSSMIPALVLNPKPNENILDMAAAPGGKTTQIAAISNNEAMITACEKNKIRAERLKYNIEKQGARVNTLVVDARKLDDFFSFDKILLDAPCSGSGTLDIFSDKFNLELIERSKKTQEELLKKAIKILKVGGELVYSTCSILKEENEDVIEKFLKNKNIELVPIDSQELNGVELLPVKIEGTICIKPNEFYEGFFVAKLRKIKEV